MTTKRLARVQVKPLNLTVGTKALSGGVFQQKYSRDENAFYPNYSAILPLKVTVVVNVQDPDGILPTSVMVPDRIAWYKNQVNPANKIDTVTNPNYAAVIENNTHILKIMTNTPVEGAFNLIGVAFYTNPKTGKQESIESAGVLLSTIYYESTNLSLRAETSTNILVDPTKIDDSQPANWHVPLQAMLKSGENDLDYVNAVYIWYIQEGSYIRRILATDEFAVSKPNASGEYSRRMVVDASKFDHLKLYCRAVYKGKNDPYPTSPTDPSLEVAYTVRVALPVFQKAEQIPVAGAYISPKDVGTTMPVISRCEITAGGRIIEDPTKYYAITWFSDDGAGTVKTIGFGETLATTVKDLGVTYNSPVAIGFNVEEKIGKGVEGSVYNGINAVPVYQFGKNQIANRLGAYVVSCPDGINPVIIGKLKNNNWNRFEDGSLAPTTVNSAAEDKGYNVMYGWITTIHTIDNATVGDKTMALFSDNPFTYEGLQSRAIPPTLINPCLPAEVDGKFRTMWFKYKAGDGGSDGYLGIKSYNQGSCTYPATNMNQLTTDTRSMGHNADKNATIPFAPLMDWHLLNITNALMNKFGTVYLHDVNKFGGGISSNTVVTVDNRERVTGVMYRVLAADPWIYERLALVPSLGMDAAGTKKTWSEIISRNYPRMACMETQMALSYAAENNIQPDTSFSFNYRTYRYYNIPNTKTLLEGEMNARLVQTVSHSNIAAFDTSGNPIIVDNINIRLQTSAVYGMDLCSGDAGMYAGAGAEKIAIITDAAGGNSNNEIRHWQCIDQSKLTIDKKISSLEDGAFDFMRNPAYKNIGMSTQFSGLYSRLFRGTRYSASRAGALYDNTAYNNVANYTTSPAGTRSRLMNVVRGIGTSTDNSARFAQGYTSCGYNTFYFCGGFQVRLPEETI